METVNNRINYFINASNKNVREFAKIANIPQTTLNEAATRNKDIRVSLVQKIVAAFPDLNADWLITGQGNMYKHESVSVDSQSGDRSNINVGRDIIGSEIVGNNRVENNISLPSEGDVKIIRPNGQIDIQSENALKSDQQRVGDLENMVTELKSIIAQKDLLIKEYKDLIELLKHK